MQSQGWLVGTSCTKNVLSGQAAATLCALAPDFVTFKTSTQLLITRVIPTPYKPTVAVCSCMRTCSVSSLPVFQAATMNASDCTEGGMSTCVPTKPGCLCCCRLTTMKKCDASRDKYHIRQATQVAQVAHFNCTIILYHLTAPSNTRMS